MSDVRRARVERRTSETEIDLTLVLDGSGRCEAATGVGFFDHMLHAFARHGLFDLSLTCRGDLDVDAHHSVEDVGICLGQALAGALGDKAGIQRFGHAYVPMDDALARAVVDLSGRAYLALNAAFRDGSVGGLPVALVPEFLRGLRRPRAPQPARRPAARRRRPPRHRGHLQGPGPRPRHGHPALRSRLRRAVHQGHPIEPIHCGKDAPEYHRPWSLSDGAGIREKSRDMVYCRGQAGLVRDRISGHCFLRVWTGSLV